MSYNVKGAVRVSVEVDQNDEFGFEKALKKFKKKVKKSNLMVDIFNNQQYRKPSDKKREQKRKSILRNKYDVLREKELESKY